MDPTQEAASTGSLPGCSLILRPPLPCSNIRSIPLWRSLWHRTARDPGQLWPKTECLAASRRGHLKYSRAMLMQCASFRRGNLQRLTLLVGCLAVCLHPAAATTNLSTWVSPAASGRLLARPDFLGNRVIDASGVGYKGGTVPLPSATTVPIRTNISPVVGDNVANIQAAINYISGLPLDTNGFRGAILLNAGTYPCGSTIKISASGVVLRGVGSSTNGTNESIRWCGSLAPVTLPPSPAPLTPLPTSTSRSAPAALAWTARAVSPWATMTSSAASPPATGSTTSAWTSSPTPGPPTDTTSTWTASSPASKAAASSWTRRSPVPSTPITPTAPSANSSGPAASPIPASNTSTPGPITSATPPTKTMPGSSSSSTAPRTAGRAIWSPSISATRAWRFTAAPSTSPSATASASIQSQSSQAAAVMPLSWTMTRCASSGIVIRGRTGTSSSPNPSPPAPMCLWTA